ncbi:unnamed protein product [Diamesa serratosioi]
METALSLTRYLHTGSFEPNYSNFPSEINLKTALGNHSKIIAIVPVLIEIDPLMVFRVVKRAIQSGLLRRMDESLLILAYCLREEKNDILRHEIYDSLDKILSTPTLLMKFFSYFSKMLNKKLVLNHGMKRVLTKWYFSKSASELVDIFATNKKFYGISHKTIFKIFRVKIQDPEKDAIIKTLFQTSQKVIETPETTEAMTKLCKFKLLKRCTTEKEVIAILNKKEYIYKLEHLPSFAVKCPEVMELIIPNMSIKTILDNMINFYSHKFLNVSENISRVIYKQLRKTELVREEKPNPFRVFFVMRALEEVSKLVYSTCAEKEDSDKEEVIINIADITPPCDKITFSNPYILKQLYFVFNQTMREQTRTGVRYYITIDFRRFSHRHSFICNNKHVFCAEAQVITALILLKKEKEVTVMTFTEDKDRLSRVPFTSETSLENAMDIYEKGMQETPKTVHNTSLPLKIALETKTKVDVFITIVDSIARSRGKKTIKPAPQLQAYRDGMDLKLAKYIIINLSRKTQDLPKEEGSKGILEINGIGPDTLNIIEAYSNNCFI